MEIAKLRLQLSIVLERVAVHLQGVWCTIARLGRSAAEKLHEACCTGKTDLRKLQVSFHNAVVVANGKIKKFRSQLSVILEGVAVHLQGAWCRLRRSVAEKLHEACCTGKTDLRKLQVSFHNAVIVANGKIKEFRSQLSVILERVVVHLQGAWCRLRRSAAEKLHEACCTGKTDLRKLQVSFHNAVVVANEKIKKFRSQLSVILERVVVHLQGAWCRLRRSAAEKLHEACCTGKTDLRKLQVSFHNAVVFTNGKIKKFGSQLFSVLRQVAVHVQRVLSAPMRLGSRIAGTPRRLREARLARQNDLRTLLASSPDPVIVTNSNRCLVAANSQGLDLFGVSKLNMSQFTMGTFLSHGQILEFDRNRSPSIRPEERQRKCQIRRLDGTSWVAECLFVANVVPHQNLYRFQHVTPQRIAQMGSPASYTKDGRSPLDVHPEHHKAS